METKKQIRNEIIARRNKMDMDELLSKSYDIMERCVSHFLFAQAKKILIFINFESEVNTKGIIEYAFLLQKEVYCPVIIGDTMEFMRIYALDDVKPGYHNILEPTPSEQNKWMPSQQDDTLVIVPGVAFDLLGNRIGYGKGFYDRFFQKEQNLAKMALCFECQILESLPVESTDCNVDFIITEQRVIEIEQEDTF